MSDAALPSALQSEQTFVENPFGTVTSKRVIYYRSKGWFSGGSREDIPLQHVTSVRLDITRSIVLGIILLLFALPMIGVGPAVVKLFGLVLFAFIVIIFWGSPAVIVNTAGRDLSAARGWPWQRPQATAFVDALRAQLFKA